MTPEITAAASVSAAAPVPIIAAPRTLSESETADLRRVDEPAVAALRAHDRAALRSLAAKGVDVEATVTAISEAECVGEIVGFEASGDELTVRHVLGYKDHSAEGKCEGVHELRMQYVGRDVAGARLTGAHRWGW